MLCCAVKLVSDVDAALSLGATLACQKSGRAIAALYLG